MPINSPRLLGKLSDEDESLPFVNLEQGAQPAAAAQNDIAIVESHHIPVTEHDRTRVRPRWDVGRKTAQAVLGSQRQGIFRQHIPRRYKSGYFPSQPLFQNPLGFPQVFILVV